MRKWMFLALGAAISFLILCPRPANAQSDLPKLEVGAQFSVIRLTDFDSTEPGVGGRLTYNISRHLSAEGEVNFFPREQNFFSGGHKVQGLVGAKYGWRSDKLGIFGKLRPGVMYFDKVFTPCPPGLLCTAITVRPTSEANFALDVGGVVEYYPSRHTSMRLDLGDTLIRYDGFTPTFTNHNLQMNVGVGYRF